MRYLSYLLLFILLVSCTPRLYDIKETRELMGTVVTITVYDNDQNLARNAVDMAFDEITRIDALLSNYKNDSEVSVLNRDKVIVNPSDDLIVNIKKSIEYGELSDGAFDITVQPMLDLYTESFGLRQRPPTEEEIGAVLEKIDYKKVVIEDNKISIGEDQKITLGGIAKGYSVDKAIDVLKRRGIKNALINAGGDLRAIGKKYGSSPWSIALANPRDKNDFVTTIYVTDGAVVTSGDYERYFNENKSFHHIVNPLTGYSATELISVTIIADNAFDADAISTAVFVLGEKKGMDLVKRLDASALLITNDRRIIQSEDFSGI